MTTGSFEKNYDYLKNNSKLIHRTDNDEFEIYLTDNNLLTIVTLPKREFWTMNRLEDNGKWNRIVKIFKRFGIIIE